MLKAHTEPRSFQTPFAALRNTTCFCRFSVVKVQLARILLIYSELLYDKGSVARQLSNAFKKKKTDPY